MKDRIELIKQFTPMGFKVGAEVGVLEGSFSRAICRYNPDIKLYAIDGWEILENGHKRFDRQVWTYNRAVRKLEPYNVTIIKDFSVNASKQFEDGSLDFVYIDADHTYKAVNEDIAAWAPKVRAGGVVAGHDYQLIEVKKAVDEHAEKVGAKLMATDYDKFNSRSKLVERSWYYIK
jgi:hypothetical protein